MSDQMCLHMHMVFLGAFQSIDLVISFLLNICPRSPVVSSLVSIADCYMREQLAG